MEKYLTTKLPSRKAKFKFNFLLCFLLVMNDAFLKNKVLFCFPLFLVTMHLLSVCIIQENGL